MPTIEECTKMIRRKLAVDAYRLTIRETGHDSDAKIFEALIAACKPYGNLADVVSSTFSAFETEYFFTYYCELHADRSVPLTDDPTVQALARLLPVDNIPDLTDRLFKIHTQAFGSSIDATTVA